MRATRAYMASIGTTGLLVLSSILLLMVGSTLVAFNGWPGDGDGAQPESVIVEAGRVVAAGGPEQVALVAASAADTVAAAPVASGEGAAAVRGRSAQGDTLSGDVSVPSAPEAPTGPPAELPPAAVTPGDPGPAPSGGDDILTTLLPRQDVTLTDGVADGLESTTNLVGTGVLGTLSPELGQLVTGTGQALTDLVRSLDGTPPPPR